MPLNHLFVAPRAVSVHDAYRHSHDAFMRTTGDRRRRMRRCVIRGVLLKPLRSIFDRDRNGIALEVTRATLSAVERFLYYLHILRISDASII